MVDTDSYALHVLLQHCFDPEPRPPGIFLGIIVVTETLLSIRMYITAFLSCDGQVNIRLLLNASTARRYRCLESRKAFTGGGCTLTMPAQGIIVHIPTEHEQRASELQFCCVTLHEENWTTMSSSKIFTDDFVESGINSEPYAVPVPAVHFWCL